jgi:hypothetical protein
MQHLVSSSSNSSSSSLRSPDKALSCAGDENGPILGATDGFVAPAFGLMHCDTLQVFTKG